MYCTVEPCVFAGQGRYHSLLLSVPPDHLGEHARGQQHACVDRNIGHPGSLVNMATILLSDLVDEFVASIKANGYAKATVKVYESGSRRLLAHVGNIQARNVLPRHVDDYFAARQSSGKAGAGTLNTELVSLRALFRFATQRRYIPAGADPTVHRRRLREVRRDRVRIPAAEFDRLLDCATDPRDRIAVALGLFLFLRQGELQALRVGDVDLTHGLLGVEVVKSKLFDQMPISAELDRELRRWFATYSQSLGRPLRADDCLVPTKRRYLFKAGASLEDNLRNHAVNPTYDPARPMRLPLEAAQRALKKFGVELRDEGGKAANEGGHTLRRSGARALFDRLVGEGYDGALRTVQAMLHHSSSATTEGYLGIHLDKKRRNELIQGKPLFPVSKHNVLDLESRRGSEARVG